MRIFPRVAFRISIDVVAAHGVFPDRNVHQPPRRQRGLNHAPNEVRRNESPGGTVMHTSTQCRDEIVTRALGYPRTIVQRTILAERAGESGERG